MSNTTKTFVFKGLMYDKPEIRSRRQLREQRFAGDPDRPQESDRGIVRYEQRGDSLYAWVSSPGHSVYAGSCTVKEDAGATIIELKPGWLTAEDKTILDQMSRELALGLTKYSFAQKV